ncbi:hypothetical protein [Nocardia sp. NPDC058114]
MHSAREEFDVIIAGERPGVLSVLEHAVHERATADELFLRRFRLSLLIG